MDGLGPGEHASATALVSLSKQLSAATVAWYITGRFERHWFSHVFAPNSLYDWARPPTCACNPLMRRIIVRLQSALLILPAIRNQVRRGYAPFCRPCSSPRRGLKLGSRLSLHEPHEQRSERIEELRAEA